MSCSNCGYKPHARKELSPGTRLCLDCQVHPVNPEPDESDIEFEIPFTEMTDIDES